jgi:hypothetical protein
MIASCILLYFLLDNYHNFYYKSKIINYMVSLVNAGY